MIEVVRGSLLDQPVEAIVNAANTAMRGGGGIDGAIHRAAGPGLVQELMKIAPHGCKTGQVVVTSGHRLSQRLVIHTPGPYWSGGLNGEPGLLADCYRNSLEAASRQGARFIGFCSISTGIFRYPLDQAAALSLQTVDDWLQRNLGVFDKVVFAMWGAEEHDAYSRALSELQSSAHP